MRTPKYRKHGSRDRGLVEFQGRRHLLPGPFNSVESLDAYRDFLHTHVFAGSKRQPPIVEAVIGTVGSLVLAFLDDADARYRGNKDTEYGNLRASLLPLYQHSGEVAVAKFGPLRLADFQRFLEETGNSRDYINWQVSRVRRCFKWGVSKELVPFGILEALKAVAPLKAGQTAAKESKKRQPVPWQHVEPILSFLTPGLAALVKAQWYIGCRCKSLCHAKPGQFDRSQQPWLWRPQHKRENAGTELVLPVGPRAQALLLPIIERKKPGEFLFSPRDVRPNPRYRMRYYTRTVGQAIERAIIQANTEADKEAKKQGRIRKDEEKIPHWAPHQIRHAKGHSTRDVYGIEAAQAVLGHESLESTQIYSSRRLELAKTVAIETG